MRRLSIIIPALNEAAGIGTTLAALAQMRERGAEVIVVDGGSSDDTIARAQPLADRVLAAPRGRAAQMNAGAAAATGDVLLFLHADSRLPADADRLILASVGAAAEAWGRFDVAIEGRHPLLPVIACFMNRRSRLTGIATGDQGLFVTRALFAAAGGYPPIALMEDVALSQALRARGAPRCLRERIVTSGRRWERHGVWRTMALMWRLRWAYWRGADPALLARRYERG